MSCVFCAAWASKFARKSVFCPEKPANSSPLSLSPPKSPVSNASACRGTPQSQPVSAAEVLPHSPPRFSHVTRQPAELVTAEVTPPRYWGGIEPPQRRSGDQRLSHVTMGSRYQSLFGPKTVSPLRHRSLWGRKVRSWLGKAKSEIRPRSIPKSDWGLARAWCGLRGIRRDPKTARTTRTSPSVGRLALPDRSAGSACVSG